MKRTIAQLRQQVSTGIFVGQDAAERWDEACKAFTKWQKEELEDMEEGFDTEYTGEGYEMQKRRIEALRSLYRDEVELAQKAGIDTTIFEFGFSDWTREPKLLEADNTLIQHKRDTKDVCSKSLYPY